LDNIFQSQAAAQAFGAGTPSGSAALSATDATAISQANGGGGGV